MTQDQALALWEYKDGHLYWRETVGSKAKAGTKAGNISRLPRRWYDSSYWVLCYQYKGYLMHRIIFLMFNGYLPKSLDHIDGDSLNNRIENLRPCNNSQNQHNRRKQRNNTSGFKGVSWNKKDQRWAAFIVLQSKKHHLGYFSSAEEAHEEYKLAAAQMHGEFANFG